MSALKRLRDLSKTLWRFPQHMRQIAECEQRLSEEIRLHQETNAQLLRAQAEFSAVLDSEPRALIVVELDGRIRRSNPAAKRMFETLSAAELRTNSLLRDYMPTSYVEEFDHSFRRSCNREHVTAMKMILRSDGLEQYYWIQFYPILSPYEEVIGIGVSLENMTPLRQAEQAWRRSEERYRAAIEGSLDAFYLLRAVKDAQARVVDFTLVDINRLAEQEIGRPREQVIGKNISELFPIVRQDDSIQRYIEAFEMGRAFEDEYMVEVDDAPRWYYRQVVSLSDGVAIITRNITERKQGEHQTLLLTVERERSKILSKFISSASHEFRTPLTVIESTLYLLERTLSDEKQHQRIMRIREQADHILNLVEALMTMLTLDSITQLDVEPLDVNALLFSLVESLREPLANYNVELDLTASLILRGNASWLRQAFWQLLNNAYRFMEKGGRLEVHTRDEGDKLIVEIVDHGIGIPAQHLAHIFERFYRIDSAQSTRGIGLGLSIARRIFELHEATISVESEPGSGSRFKVTFVDVIHAAS